MTMIKNLFVLKKERKTKNTNKKFILYYNSILSVSSMKLLCDDDFFSIISPASLTLPLFF